MEYNKENTNFIGGAFIGLMMGCLIFGIVLRMIIGYTPKIVGFPETGYHIKYQNTVYKLVPIEEKTVNK